MPKNKMEELREIRWLKLQIDRDRERAQRLREQVGDTTTRLRESPSRGSAHTDIMAEQVAALVDMEREVLASVVEAEKRIMMATHVVDELPGAQRMIIRLRYLEGYSWRQVARATHYTERRCLQIHEEGVGNLI